MPCVDYRAHEAGWDHRHTGPVYRWRASDGCRGTDCDGCRMTLGVIERTAIDRDGLPIDPAIRTEAERLIDAARGGLPVDSGYIRRG